MIQTIINLCCKVSKLRRENKRLLSENITTCRNLTQATSLIDFYQKSLHEAKLANCSIFMFSVPQSNVFMESARINEPYRDMSAEAHYAEFKERQLTDKMKIDMFDQLLQQGFIKKYELDNELTRYEIRVVRPLF